jgi:phosphate-selective porin OprO/OprP
MECALTYDAFITPSRRVGAGLAAGVDSWSVNTGVFGETAEGDAGDTPDGGEADSGITASGRFTFAPLYEETLLTHLGAWAPWRDPSRGEATQLQTHPESHITDVRLVDTGELAGVEDVQTYGLEAATVLGPFRAGRV